MAQGGYWEVFVDWMHAYARKALMNDGRIVGNYVSFQDISFSLIFHSVKIIHLHVSFWHLSIWASQVCILLSDIICGKFSVFASDSSYVSPFLLLLVFPLPICHTFCSHSTVLEYSVWVFFQSFFSVAFQFCKFVLTCPQVQRFFLQSHQSTNKPIKANLHFYYSVFDL